MTIVEHPVEQPIRAVSVRETDAGSEYYEVGRDGVTLIEAATKSGMYADIPYVRIWKGEKCHSEHCQHNVLGVYFTEPAS